MNFNKDIPIGHADNVAIYMDIPSNYMYWKMVEQERKREAERRHQELVREFGIEEIPKHPVDVNVRFEDV